MRPSRWYSIARHLRQEWLLLILLLALPALLALQPLPVRTGMTTLPALVHWETLATLAGLMVLSRGLEDSGYLFRAGRWLLARMHSERSLAFALVLFSAGLAAVITNDVALFIVVPLTLGLSASAALPVGRLVVFEALAVNAGSTLSPVGNPQNLFLWQTAGVSFLEFCVAMAPLGLGLILMLVLAIPIAFTGRGITVSERLLPPPRQRALLLLSLCLYPALLIAVEAGQSLAATGLILLLYLGLARGVLRNIDWPLLAVFALMFVDLGLLGALPAVAAGVRIAEELPGGLLTLGILLSQLISNVPATLFLAGFSDDWRTLAWAVSVGGFGLAIGSLANVIALRLAREPGLWVDFHRWSLPALAGGWVVAALSLRASGSGLA
jgi:Na+/H+ antiporter NhaD/arsenite permease-like protein